MIDGIKIICIGTKPNQWVKNPLLSFTSKVDEQTGEIKSDTKIAIYRGLRFFLIPSTIADKTHCIIRGSLAKYYNSGRDNAFDFDLRMVHETIEELRVINEPLRIFKSKFDSFHMLRKWLGHAVRRESTTHPRLRPAR